jgi:predicted AAA+ superfamily ATPase
LLGGRAIRYELFGFVSEELGEQFDLTQLLNRGYLPRHSISDDATLLLRSYVEDYLKEEIANEGLVRSLSTFSHFLTSSVLSDTELLNYSTLARDCGTSVPTVKEYFQILVDTLLGRFLPSYTKSPKRRVIQAPKFYFMDVGIVNYLSKRGKLEPGSELFGKAFENWIHHEIQAYNHYRQIYADISYWRLASGIEVDFIVNDMECAIEAKASQKITSDHLKGLRALSEDHSKVKKRVVVSLEAKKRTTEDKIEIFPFQEFAKSLWNGEIF